MAGEFPSPPLAEGDTILVRRMFHKGGRVEERWLPMKIAKIDMWAICVADDDAKALLVVSRGGGNWKRV